MKKSKVLLILSCILLLNTTSYGATCDDVRQLYGEKPLDTPEYHAFIEYVDTMGEMLDSKQSATEIINAQDYLASVYSKYEELSIEKDKLREEVVLIMKEVDSNSTMEVIGKAKQLVDIEDKLSSLNLKEVDFNFEVDTEQYDMLNKQIGNNRNYINDRYDIGELGVRWPIAVARTKKVYKGFGSDGSENGVYINKAGAERVISLFTGIVTKVETSEYYGKWVEIQSGKGLALNYSFLDNISVKVGDKVKAGDIISSMDKDKDYIYIELILDGEYKNPMLVMGEDGVKSNNNWIYGNIGNSDMGYLLNMNSYDYTPATKIWDTTEESAVLQDDIISIK